MWAKPLPKNAKSPLPVDVCRSKTSLLKFPNLIQLGYYTVFKYAKALVSRTL